MQALEHNLEFKSADTPEIFDSPILSLKERIPTTLIKMKLISVWD
jgi:hypothetical protein